MKRNLLAVLTALALTAAGAAAQSNPAEEADRSSFDTLFDRTDSGNVSQAALASYNAGVRLMQRAEKQLEKAAQTSDAKKREKLESGAAASYESASEQFLDAIRSRPDMVKAYAELGRTYQALDKHAEAVQVYNAGLERAPDDTPMFANRAEAMLELNGLREATAAYTELTERDRELAARLLDAMKVWVADRRAHPEKVDAKAVDALAGWIEQQETGSG